MSIPAHRCTIGSMAPSSASCCQSGPGGPRGTKEVHSHAQGNNRGHLSLRWPRRPVSGRGLSAPVRRRPDPDRRTTFHSSRAAPPAAIPSFKGIAKTVSPHSPNPPRLSREETEQPAGPATPQSTTCSPAPDSTPEADPNLTQSELCDRQRSTLGKALTPIRLNSTTTPDALAWIDPLPVRLA